MKNQNKKLAKVLAATIFGVGFVTPLMFSNIVEAASFGAGGAVQWLSDAVLEKTDGTKWATNTGTADANYVVFHGVKFKIVATVHKDTKDSGITGNKNALVTLYSYETDGTKFYNTNTAAAGVTSDGNAKYNKATELWGEDTKHPEQAYAGSDLMTAMDSLYANVFESDYRILPVKLVYSTDGTEAGTVYEQKQTEGGAEQLDSKYVWAPGTVELGEDNSSAAAGEWKLKYEQCDTGKSTWLRSPNPSNLWAAYNVDYEGYVWCYAESLLSSLLLRPALQIWNQTFCVFTTNVTIPTNGVFAADESGSSPVNYTLNDVSTAGFVPGFTPTSGVTLDGTKIGITTKHSQTGGSDNDYATTGLLTTNSGTTWDAINTGDNANIAYMAQVKDGYLDLQNVEGTGVEGAGYTLKIFGLKAADTTVTELASGAIPGLSKGVDGKIHMKVSGTVNAGVPVTASNGAVVDFGGGALTAKLDFHKDGKLEMKDQMTFGINGYVKQEIGSEVEVPVTVIESDAESDTNVAGKAMFTGVDSTENLNVASGNLTIDGPVTDGKYYVLVAGKAVEDGTLQAADLWKKEKISLDTSNYFLADYDYVTNGDAIAIKVQGATVEEANTSGLAAVQQGALAVSKEFTGEVENHLGMIANPKLADKEKYDKEVWATYINTKETTEGMKLEGIEGNNTAKYSGAVVGVDFYSSKKSIAGLAFSYITGDVDSYSGTTATKNDAKYYGVSFYDRVTNGNTALIYDIGYIRGNNDVSQYYNGKPMTSDVKTNTYTAGARWETAIETGKSRVVPFAAFRYMRVNNGDYTNSHNTRFEAKNQNLYIPKVGIAWTGDFVAPNSVCTWRPSVEVGYLWNLGDRSADSNVLVGTRIADVGYDIADRNSFYGKAGIELMAKNFTAGVFYRYLKGNAVKNNKWNINMSWAF